MARKKGLRAEDLVELLGAEIFDIADGAARLGIEVNSLEWAAQREHIRYVQYGNKKLFTLSDLLDYGARRGPGSASKLEKQPHFVARAGYSPKVAVA